jgi:hypothetical protein
MALADKLAKRWDRELRRPHEDQAERHICRS